MLLLRCRGAAASVGVSERERGSVTCTTLCNRGDVCRCGLQPRVPPAGAVTTTALLTLMRGRFAPACCLPAAGSAGEGLPRLWPAALAVRCAPGVGCCW
jgi:hypothetical protein